MKYLWLWLLATPLYAQVYPFPGPGSQHTSAPPPTGNCGAIGSYPSLTIGNQGACGDVSDGRPAPPSSPTIITSCSPTITAGHSYQLGANLTCGASSNAINVIGPNTTLDLAGYQVQGTIHASTDTNGIHIYSSAPGDSVTCNVISTDTVPDACIYANSSSSNFNTLFEVDHITVTNTQNSNNSMRDTLFDFSNINSGTLTNTPNIAIHHITAVSATGLSSSRIVNLQVQATGTGGVPSNKAYPVFYNNLTTCKSNAAACQGIVAYGIWNTKIYSNEVINQLANASSTETPRGFICDQTAGCEAHNNYFIAQDGRAMRYRGTKPTNDVNAAHDNIVDTIVAGSNPNHVAAIHMGDPDSGTEAEGLTIYNNQLNFTSGLIAMSRSATGINFQDNTVSCSGSGSNPDLYYLRYLGAASSANIWRNNVSCLVAPQSLCDSSTTGSVCQSGTASGCTVNNSVCASFPTPPANAKTFLNLQAGTSYSGASGVQPWSQCNQNNSCAAGTKCGIGTASFSVGNPMTATDTNSGGWVASSACPSPPYGWNTLWYRHMGSSFTSDDGTRTIKNSDIQNAIYDVTITPTFTAGQIVGYEFDPDIFVNSTGTGTWTAKVSIACYATDNKWHLYNQSIQNWVSTTYPCNLSSTESGHTHELKYYVTYDWTNHQYTYQNFVYDGVTVFGPSNAVTYGMWNHDSGNELNFEVQQDMKPVVGTMSATYTINAYVW